MWTLSGAAILGSAVLLITMRLDTKRLRRSEYWRERRDKDLIVTGVDCVVDKSGRLAAVQQTLHSFNVIILLRLARRWD